MRDLKIGVHLGITDAPTMLSRIRQADGAGLDMAWNRVGGIALTRSWFSARPARSKTYFMSFPADSGRGRLPDDGQGEGEIDRAAGLLARGALCPGRHIGGAGGDEDTLGAGAPEAGCTRPGTPPRTQASRRRRAGGKDNRPCRRNSRTTARS